MPEILNDPSPRHAWPSIRTMARRHLRRGKQYTIIDNDIRDSTAESRGRDEDDGGQLHDGCFAVFDRWGVAGEVQEYEWRTA